jgi:PAS domain S-box-containing protein
MTMCLGYTVKRTLLILLLVLLPVSVGFTSADPHIVRIGVLAKRGLNHCRAKWHPTAVYLSKIVTPHQFVIVPLDFASVPKAVADKKIEFILTNSSSYVELEDQYGVDGIATLINRMHGGDHTLFGGVIFTKANRADLRTLKDLRGKDFMAVKKSSFGGWRMAWREMAAEGINPQKDFKSLSFGGTHDAVVYAVGNHTADAGTVRTDTLERMAAEGKIDLSEFRILNINTAAKQSTGMTSSTRRYPEWPIARLSHTPDELSARVAQALFFMEESAPAAKAAKIAGWTYPLSYQPVHDCLRDLQVGPYDHLARQSFSAFSRQYHKWFIFGGITFIAVCFAAAWVAKLNARLSTINGSLVSEVQNRKKIEAGLLESETRLQTILDHSIAGVFIIDPETLTITDANKSALEMIGAEKPSVVGRKSQQFICAAREGEYPVTDYRQIFKRTEQMLIRADGTLKSVLKTVMPFRVQGKDYLLYSFIDISQLKETQFNLESALAAANEANRSKDAFLANMSHELRTPMNGIIGMTGILQNSELTDEQSEFTDIIMKSSEGLLAIITDILDFSQIEAGTTKLDDIGFDLISLVNEVYKTIAPKAREKNLTFSHRVDEDVPAYLKGAPRHLKKAVQSLLSNAVKFTHQGSVSLHVSLAQDEEQHCTLRFAVKDTGIGIDPERKDRIFDPFSQVDYSSTRKYNGTGLGLALAKHFTGMMNGHIDFESTPAQGSTFWFTIKLEKEKSLPIREPYHVDDITGKRILVVDDNPTNRQVLAGYLRSWNLPYATAESAREALAAMQQAVSEKDPFELAVIDHMMPEMDGVDLGRAIKQDPLLKDVRMVLFTSIEIGCDTDEISSAGFDAFLAKPIRASQLLNCLKLVYSQKESPQHCHVQSDRLITHEILNQAKASGPRILVVEDNVINQRVMLKILGLHGCHAEVVENGRLAVQELCKNDYDVVLMDLQMPEMNGFEATGAIRNPGNKCLNPTVPIIAVTANSMKEDRKKCLDAGMDDYLPKPVNPKTLMEKIDQWHEKPQLAQGADMNVSN